MGRAGRGAAHHLVLRTGWLYGAHGSCFPRTIARVAREQGGVDVVDDQFGQPTWTMDVADLMVRLVESDAPQRHLARHLVGGDLLVRLRA